VVLDGVSVQISGRDGDQPVYCDVDLSIGCGELICIVGPSGSGKSVLLGLLFGELPARAQVSGSIRIFGTEVSRHYPASVLRRVGVVFQQDALFEDLSVAGNAAFALPRGEPRHERVAELLRLVGLEAGQTRRVEQLSGGQRKRLALARALAARPELILYDEPTSGLDPARSLQIATLIDATHRAAAGLHTSLVVTHDVEAILPIGQRILYVDPSSGKLLEVSPQEARSLLREPARSPALAVQRRPWRLQTELPRMLRACGEPLMPAFQFLAEPLPSSARQLLLRLRECCLGPASFIASASLLIGGLATFFALENNPLRGAMDRPVLIGLGKALVSVVAPLCAGSLFAAQIGAGETARLGHLSYSRQVQALRGFGRGRSTYLQAPLLWACMLAVPLWTLASAVLCSLASVWVATGLLAMGPHAWAAAYASELSLQDVPWLVAKSVGSGLVIGLTAVRHGLAPKSSAEDISEAVTAAIVSASLGVLLWQSALTVLQLR
jgi:ABC-type transporter Mla maintaining outer membrane lipid asymmetry ATPase subunit MlaF/ABC-type transporter Mla maintaining outer membrane lipid asymmetry permease subunit MlaE